MGTCCRAQVSEFDQPGTYLGERKTDSCRLSFDCYIPTVTQHSHVGKKKSQKHLKCLLDACVWPWMYVRPVGILEGAGQFLFLSSSHL